MTNPAFQLYKIRRLLKLQGTLIVFTKSYTNDFGEPTTEDSKYEILGLFHEVMSQASEYISKSTSNASTVQVKSSPKLLCTWEDAEQISIKDQVKFNGKVYEVNGVNNIAESNLIADVSLEEVK
mgnify:CR=1 FL=1